MPGASKTKLVLAESMKQLMQKMPLEKISVSDIVERADIGRNTFYYHFQDKYDLVIWIFQSESAALFADGIAQGNWYDAVERLEQYLQQNREFYCNALAYDGQNSLREYLFELFKEMTVQQILEQETAGGAELQTRDLEFAAEFFASAMQGLLVRWAKEGMKSPPQSYRDSVNRVLRNKWARAYFLGETVPGQTAAPQPPSGV